MTDNPGDNEARFKVTADITEAMGELERFEQAVQQKMQQITQFAQETGKSLDLIGATLRKQGADTAVLDEALKRLQGTIQQVSQEMQNISGVESQPIEPVKPEAVEQIKQAKEEVQQLVQAEGEAVKAEEQIAQATEKSAEKQKLSRKEQNAEIKRLMEDLKRLTTGINEGGPWQGGLGMNLEQAAQRLKDVGYPVELVDKAFEKLKKQIESGVPEVQKFAKALQEVKLSPADEPEIQENMQAIQKIYDSLNKKAPGEFSLENAAEGLRQQNWAQSPLAQEKITEAVRRIKQQLAEVGTQAQDTGKKLQEMTPPLEKAPEKSNNLTKALQELKTEATTTAEKVAQVGEAAQGTPSVKEPSQIEPTAEIKMPGAEQAAQDLSKVEERAKEAGAKLEEMGQKGTKAGEEVQRGTAKAPDSGFESRLQNIIAIVKKFEDEVALMKSALIEMSQRGGESVEKLAEEWKKAGNDAKVINEALRRIQADAAATAPAKPKATQKEDTQQVTQAVQQETQAVQQNNAALQQNAAATQQAALAQNQFKQNLQGVQSAEGIRKAGEDVKKLGDQFPEAGKKKDKFKENVSGLGSVAKFVFGSVLGITAVTALRDVKRYMEEAVQGGYELTKGLFELTIGVRALQRVGIDTTIGAWVGEIQKLQAQFPQFTFKELVAGASNFANLTREMGFTEKEMFSLMDASTTMAVVSGKNMQEVQRTIALALSSGYTEGLQRLGISINRVTIALKAEEMGWGRNYMSLTERQRGMATYALIMERVAAYEEDAAKYQQTNAGRMDKANASFANLKNTIGASFLPYWARFLDFLGRAASSLEKLIKIFTLLNPIAYYITGLILALGRGFDFLSKYVSALIELVLTRDWEKFGENLKKALQAFYKGGLSIGEEAMNMRKEAAFPEYSQDLKDTALGKAQSDAEKNQEEARDKMIQAMQEQNLEFVNSQEKLWADYYNDLKKIDEDGMREREKMAQDHAKKMQDINRDEAEKLAQLQNDQSAKIADINRQAEEDRADAAQKLRDQELDDEEEFQRKMRDLRNEYLFNLEDLVAKRDARGIYNLRRQYAFDRKKEAQDYADQQKDRQTAYQRELRDIELQRQRKLAALKNELAERRAEIIRDAAIRRAEEIARYQQELIDQRMAQEQEKADRRKQLTDQLKDLQNSYVERIKIVWQGIIKELNLTQQGALAVYQVLLKMYGPRGYIENLMKWYAQMMASYGSTNFNPLAPTTTPPKPTGFAEGGIAVANQPTSVLFGEKGWEAAIFKPLPGPISANQLASGGLSETGGKGGSGRLLIALELSPDLEARIVDSALGELSDVMVQVERSR